MTFSANDLPLGDAKPATAFEPFMAAAFAPAMMTSAMMMQGYNFWMSAARSMMPMLHDVAAPVVAMPVGMDVAETLLHMPVGIDVPETLVDEPVFTAEPVGQKPSGLAEARDGMGDDLTLISGIGPKIEKKLHDLGFFHWDQIADWAADEVVWVDSFLDFKGRIAREDWQAQAEALALGGVEEYVKRFGKEPR
jgi:predicted flap endonuclease-1-like 5' DNA nuclease